MPSSSREIRVRSNKGRSRTEEANGTMSNGKTDPPVDSIKGHSRKPTGSLSTLLVLGVCIILVVVSAINGWQNQAGIEHTQKLLTSLEKEMYDKLQQMAQEQKQRHENEFQFLKDNLEDWSEENHNLFLTMSHDQNIKFEEMSHNIRDVVNERYQELHQKLEKLTDDKYNDFKIEMKENILKQDTRLHEIVGVNEKGLQEINNMLKSNGQELNKKIEEGSNEIHNKVETSLDKHDTELERRQQELILTLQTRSNEQSNQLDKISQELINSLQEWSQKQVKRLEEISDRLYERQSQRWNSLNEKLKTLVHGIHENVKETSLYMSNNVEKGLHKLNQQLEKLSSKQGEVSLDQNEYVGTRSRNMYENIKREFTEFYEVLEQKSQRSKEEYEELERLSRELNTKIEKASEGFIVKLDTLSNELFKTLESSSQKVYKIFDKRMHMYLEIDLQKSLAKYIQATHRFDSSDGSLEEGSHQPYDKLSITNSADFQIRTVLDEAESLLDQGSLIQALKHFDLIVKLHPESPRGWWGHARATQKLAKQKNDDTSRTREVIQSLTKICYLSPLKKALFGPVLKMLYETQKSEKTPNTVLYKVWSDLYKRHPEFIEVQRIFGRILVDTDRYEAALKVFHQVVDRDPSDALSSARLGILYLKRLNDSANAAKYLQHALEVGFPQNHPVKSYYYDLMIAYNRLNETEKELKIVDEAVAKGYMISRGQRSIHNCATPLLSRPWWTVEQTTYGGHLKNLEDNWKLIREEALALFDNHTGLFRRQTEGITETGDWRYLLFYRNGQRHQEGCDLAPKTCALFESFEAATSCTRGQVKLSIMQPGVHVWPHSGPTNCRIRAHLGLVVPEGPRIKVLDETRTWQEGKILVFDDSFLHEVWHDGHTFRMILIVDFWHPDLTPEQRNAIKQL